MTMPVFKTKSTVRALADKYGGKWKHRHGEWFCDDGIRWVGRCLTGMDFNGEYTGETQMYLYYNDGRPTERVYL